MGNVYHTKEEMIDCVNAFYEGMVQRSEEMKRHPNYKTGENYAYLGLPPCFLIFDEYVAFFEMLGTKESVGLLSQLKKIVMLGRQAGYFLIVACQRPDAKYFSDGIRDNFNFRVGLGRISELGYGMLFGSDVKKQFFQKRIKGRGYCDVGTSVISEFYTPLVPKGHDFLQTIGRLAQERQILLMYFFLGMSDTEIGDRLKINRSTSFRSRKNSLEEIKKKLKENMNDE